MFFRISISALLLLCTLVVSGYGENQDIVVTKFHGIRPDDPDGRLGMANPERGFRWENRIGSFLETMKEKDALWIEQIHNYHQDGITVTQAYCELLEYSQRKTIPDEKIQKLQKSFDAVRENGLKLLLCFRYEMNDTDVGPTEKIILSHIRQLQPTLEKNMDIIAVLQTGFIGKYGEWHRSYHKLDKNPDAQERIITALLDILPKNRSLVIRYPRHKNAYVKRVSKRKDMDPLKAHEAHNGSPESRMGFADHGFMVDDNDAATFAPRPSREYDYMTQESLFLPMEGELFWAWNIPNGIAKDDGYIAIQRLWEHHYTLFSYAHNNSDYEGKRHAEELGARYSLDEWKEDSLDKEFLLKNFLPVSDGYFENAKGEPVQRTVFEYIRDHLGYRLELQRCEYSALIKNGEKFSANTKLVNRGFAPPINPRRIYLVFLSNENQVHIIAKANSDVRKFYPCAPNQRKKLAPEYTVAFQTKSLPQLPAGDYRVGIWMPDDYTSIEKDSRYSIRFANRDIPWFTGNGHEYGINIIGNIQVH